MMKLFNKILKRRSLPAEGGIYTVNEKGSAYNGMTGVVHHSDCGTTFMIFTGNAWLCNIKP